MITWNDGYLLDLPTYAPERSNKFFNLKSKYGYREYKGNTQIAFQVIQELLYYHKP